jgi:phage FluMu protein Com
MDHHPNQQLGPRKAIRCSDCGHLYLIAQGQRSSRCQVCGNIEFLTDQNPGAVAQQPSSKVDKRAGLAAFSQELLERKVLPRLKAAEPPVGASLAPAVAGDWEAEAQPPEDELQFAFSRVPDGKLVEEIRHRFQVEWQLWAQLVLHFGDPAYHSAYLAQAVTSGRLEKAAERYRLHQATMAPLPADRWQAEVADLMLLRLESLAAAWMEMEGRSTLQLPLWARFLPLESWAWKAAWLLVGLVLGLRLLRFG